MNSKKRYIKYKDFVIWIKNSSCKLFISNKLYLSSGKKSFNNNIQPSLKLSIVEINLIITQSDEKYLKINIYTYVSQYNSLFEETILFFFVI